MSMETVFVRQYDAPPVRREEILRYAGVRGEREEISPLLSECLEEAERVLNYSVCYTEFPIQRTESALDLGFATTASRDLRKNLSGCSSGIVFAATVGLGIDRLISRHARISPTRALLFQAVGAERIESLCEAFCRELSETQGEYLFHPRFSPGYGDLPLDLQKDIFARLDCPRRIGLHLNQSLLLSPTKSVTALIGREKREA